MKKHLVARIALLCLSGAVPAYSQSYQAPRVAVVEPLAAVGATERSASDWSVLTMAPNGAWGMATETDIGRAIAMAIANCKTAYGKELGCGAHSRAIRAGWMMAIKCGGENIIVAEKNLADAEAAAVDRENELRLRYVPDMPACVRILVVDPHGVVIGPNVKYAEHTSVAGSASLGPLKLGD